MQSLKPVFTESKLYGLMDSGIASLIGVVVGSSLTLGKDWLLTWRQDRKNLVLLAIQISSHLERFSAKCAAVALDDGEEDEDGITRKSVISPDFEIKNYDVEWNVVPPDLLLRILNLPYEVEIADGAINDATEFAGPPDYCEYFEERQYQYAGLGLEAAMLALRLRRLAKIARRPKGEWEPVAAMEAKRTEIEALRKKRMNPGY